MSAILGYLLSKDDAHNASDFPIMMEKALQKNARLDSTHRIVKDQIYIACGIQNITKESSYEKLPFYNEEHSFYFTFDGILDNREDLIQELDLSCDPNEMIADETIAYHAFLKWGNDAVSHFLGLFCFGCSVGSFLDVRVVHLMVDDVINQLGSVLVLVINSHFNGNEFEVF